MLLSLDCFLDNSYHYKQSITKTIAKLKIVKSKYLSKHYLILSLLMEKQILKLSIILNFFNFNLLNIQANKMEAKII